MNYVGRLAGHVLLTVKELYDGINQATLSGCIDVVVVRQRDGTYLCSPFHVRFGKLGVIRSKEKVVDIEVNEEPVDLYMKLGNKGEAFFVQEAPGIVPAHLVTSPITTEDHQIWKSEVGDMEDDYLADTEEDPPEPTAQNTGTGKKKRRRKKHRGDPRQEELAPPNAANVPVAIAATTPAPVPSRQIKELIKELSSDEEDSAHSSRLLWDMNSKTVSVARHNLDNYSFSDSGWYAAERHGFLTQNSSSKSDSELLVRPLESMIRDESLMQWIWGEFPESTRVAKKERQELPKAVIITPPENVHIILSSEAMENMAMAGDPISEDVSITTVMPTSAALMPDSSATSLDPVIHSDPLDVLPTTSTLTDSLEMHSGTQLHQPVGSVAVDSITECLSDSTSDLTDVAFSLCGGLSKNTEIPNEMFMAHIITYNTFAENPAIMSNPNLVVRIGNKYYNWTLAAPLRSSLQALQRNLPKATEEAGVKEKLPKNSRLGGRWFWQKKREDRTIEQSETKLETKEASQLGEGRPSVSEENLVLPRNEASYLSSDEADQEVSVVSGQERLQPQEPPTQPRSEERQSYKSLCLSSDQITSLKLNEGENKVTFSITTQYQGTARLEGTIYLWNWDDKVVISDIDGTITKSDVFGHILPQLGKDWTQQGIAKLYHSVAENGYKFLYCSARAIGMADLTRGYLKWVNDEGVTLPKGPLMLSPSSLFSAFHRDVIEKKPEIFKIECLTDIKNLFQQNKQPFYAAFGNRTNDVFAYKAVGVHEGRIFTVNPRGELIQEQTKGNKSSYSRLSELLEHVFPLLGKEQNEAFVLPEYSWFNYWRLPIPEFNPDELL